MFHVSSLKESIKFLNDNHIDIVLINLFLDDSYGIHTFDNLFKQFPEIPFIVLTDIDNDIIGKNTVKKGAQDYLVTANLNNPILNRTITYAIERKLSEQNLRKSEEKYRELFMSSKDAIYISTVEGEFIDINPAGLELFGYEVEDIDYLKVKDLYVDIDDRKTLISTLEEKQEIEDYEIELIKKR